MDTNQNPQSLDEILKKNKNFLIILLILAVGIFYWTQLRPIDIRKNCAVSSENIAVQMYQGRNAQYPDMYPYTFGTSSTYNTVDYNTNYAQCLAENGLQ